MAGVQTAGEVGWQEFKQQVRPGGMEFKQQVRPGGRSLTLARIPCFVTFARTVGGWCDPTVFVKL